MDDNHFCLEVISSESFSLVFHALRRPRRRLIVGLLMKHITSEIQCEVFRVPVVSQIQDTDYEVSVRQIAKEITAVENNITLSQATGPPYYSTYNSILESHAPALESVQAIEFDKHRKQISPAENLPVVTSVMMASYPSIKMYFHRPESE